MRNCSSALGTKLDDDSYREEAGRLARLFIFMEILISFSGRQEKMLRRKLVTFKKLALCVPSFHPTETHVSRQTDLAFDMQRNSA